MSTDGFLNAPTFLEIAGERVATYATGGGPDLVFVHGWPLHGATWRNIVPVLAQRFTCHVIDLPGTGRSELPRAGVSLRSHASVVRVVIDRLGIERVGFVAHDSGGAVARLAAADLGDRVWGMVLGNTEIAGYRPPMLERLLRIASLPGSRHLFALMMRSRLLRRSAYGFGGCFDDMNVIDGDFGDLFVEPLASSKQIALGQLALVADFDWSVIDRMEETHRNIVAPALLLWGERDPWFPLSRARKMVSQFPGGAELRTLPGKLFVHEELPHLWAKQALEFLAQCVDRSAQHVENQRVENERAHLTVS